MSAEAETGAFTMGTQSFSLDKLNIYDSSIYMGILQKEPIPAKEDDIRVGATVTVKNMKGEFIEPFTITSLSDYVPHLNRMAGKVPNPESIDDLKSLTTRPQFDIQLSSHPGSIKTGTIHKDGIISIMYDITYVDTGDLILYIMPSSGGRRHRRKTKKARKHRRRHSRRN